VPLREIIRNLRSPNCPIAVERFQLCCVMTQGGVDPLLKERRHHRMPRELTFPFVIEPQRRS
jgi:hypothetical protein